MYLKALEIQGFKSFPDKTVLAFGSDITAVVGPNGSGKSNIADAIRWVMGEQSTRTLRGSKMEDVIFNGTEKRKGLGFAEVTLVLDNTEHLFPLEETEVAVTRRYYRSGESEYYINRRACRLKDINELFMDTGLGREGYSIIGQGRIDEILSVKSADRREVFEEAAGISRFRHRKEEAERKLERTDENLVRINDKIGELELQVEPLRVQAEKTKKYNVLRDELKGLEISVWLETLERIRANSVKVKADCEAAIRQRDGAKAAVEGLYVRRDALADQMRDKDIEAEGLRGKQSGLDEQVHACENSIALLKNDIKNNSANAQRIRQELEQQEGRAGSLAAQIADGKGRLEEIRGEMAACRERIDALNRDAQEVLGSAGSLNEELASLQERERLETASAGEAKELLSALAAAAQELYDREEKLGQELQEQEDRAAQAREALDATRKELDKVTEDRDGAKNVISGYQMRLQSRQRKLDAAQEAHRRLQMDENNLNARIKMLAEMEKMYEGYSKAVKLVMGEGARGGLRGVRGPVAGLLHVPDQYAVAIEIALGGAMQNLVVERDGDGKNAINYLKRRDGGRATFLPLTSITRPQEFKTPEVLKEKGVIGMADELVSTDQKYRNVAKAMLGRIVVADNVDNAVRIARKYDYGIRMVTLEGELLVPGGAISGGAFKNSSNLLGRRREMEELEKKIGKLTRIIQDTNAAIEETKAHRNQLRMEIEAMKADMQRCSIEQNTVRISISQARERMAEEEQGFDSMKKEEKEIESQIQEIVSSKETIQKELSASEEAEQATQQQIALWQKELEESRREESDSSAHVAEWDLKVEKMLQTQEFHQANVDRIGGETEHSRRELEEIEEALLQSLQDAEEKSCQIQEIRRTIAASHDVQTQSEAKLKEDMEKKENLSSRQKNFFTAREELAERMTALDKEVYRLSAQKERLEETVESQINYMWNEYEITLSDALSVRNEEMADLPAMKREIGNLKDQIRKLGDVNVNAIEDYKNLMERYTFMKTQHDDLVEAEKTLEGIIQELDSAMRKQFNEKFAEICHEFDKVFKELFGGGKGTLELMEEEDILEAGIRIIAQPPGKKLQNMMQLSGGEKALTAISLLFAIQNLKPSPFCLLDEIEAALDESNVSRYAKYLHKLTRHTQFIVITHRRGTMERADRLYGITMQEKGVSTLVSVNLVDKDLT